MDYKKEENINIMRPINDINTYTERSNSCLKQPFDLFITEDNLWSDIYSYQITHFNVISKLKVYASLQNPSDLNAKYSLYTLNNLLTTALYDLDEFTNIISFILNNLQNNKEYISEDIQISLLFSLYTKFYQTDPEFIYYLFLKFHLLWSDDTRTEYIGFVQKLSSDYEKFADLLPIILFNDKSLNNGLYILQSYLDVVDFFSIYDCDVILLFSLNLLFKLFNNSFLCSSYIIETKYMDDVIKHYVDYMTNPSTCKYTILITKFFLENDCSIFISKTTPYITSIYELLPENIVCR